jgi:hypothetical protein
MHAPVPDLTFRETLSGPLTLGESDPMVGAGRGRHTPLTFHATISVDDMEAFIRDPAHVARLVAHISYAPLGDYLPVKRGSFNLFKAGDDPDTRLMTYGMAFEHLGREYYLSGTKTIRDGEGADLWRDTTRLYCSLHEGTSERGPVIGAGVLKMGLGNLLRLVSSMRSGREGAAGVQAVARFGRYFLGTLWDVYAPLARERAAEELDAVTTH